MKDADQPEGENADGLTRRRVLALGATATGAALGVGAFATSAAAWKRFDVDFEGCSAVNLVVARDDLDFDPPAVARVIVAVDGEAVCRTVEVTEAAATTMPARYGQSPVIRYPAGDGESILGVVGYNYRENRFSEPICVMLNPQACGGEDGPSAADADCVQAGVEGYWNGEVRECWFDPIDRVASSGGGSDGETYDPPAADDLDPRPNDRIEAPDGAQGFGSAVTFDESGDVLLVGAPGGPRGEQPGHAYVYAPDGDDWSRTATLAPDGTAAGDDVGRAVALDDTGETALVGAPGANAVYEFRADGDGWHEQATIELAEADLREVETVGAFGAAVTLDAAADTTVVGAPKTSNPGIHEGEAYVFERDRDGWSFQRRVRQVVGEAIQCGHDVDLATDGETAAVGAPVREYTSVQPAGWVRLFERAGGEWTPGPQLTARDGEDKDDVGYAVACDAAGTAVVTGDPRDDVDGARNQGSAVVFAEVDGEWREIEKLTASDGAAEDGFGEAVDVDADGTIAVVGTPRHAWADGGTPAAYCFATDGVGWTEVDKLTPAGDAPDADFGDAVAVDAYGNHLAVGAPVDDRDASGAGSVTVYVTW